jgi:hypothetical protein
VARSAIAWSACLPSRRRRWVPALHGVCAPAPLRAGARVHLELFARRRVVIVPAAIGLRGARSTAGRVVAARCRARLWTLDRTGVVRFAGRATLRDLFAVWGAPLARGRLLGFRGAVRVYVNGVLRRGDPRALALRDRDEIVVQVSGYVRPHSTYRFPLH